MDVGDDNYQAVTLKEVFRGVIDAVPRVTNRALRRAAAAAAGTRADGSAKLVGGHYLTVIRLGTLHHDRGTQCGPIGAGQRSCVSWFFQRNSNKGG